MTVVFIAGMHRSGTSMVARMLNLAGLYLGEDEDINFTGPDNVDGFWENRHFVQLNDQILLQNDGAWDMPTTISAEWKISNNAQTLQNEASELIKKFEKWQFWGWKDPRNSLTIDFWKELLPSMKVIVCVRNPLEVARSLNRRGAASNRFGFNLWSRYYRTLLSAIPKEKRIITHYDSYFIDPKKELSRVLNFLEMSVKDSDVSAALDSIKTPSRHNANTIQDLLATNPPYELLDLYKNICNDAGPVYQTLVEDNPLLSYTIPDTYTEVDSVFPEDQQNLLAAREKTIVTLMKQAGENTLYIRRLQDKIAENEELVWSLQETLQEKTATIADLHQQINENEQDRITLEKELNSIRKSWLWLPTLRLKNVLLQVAAWLGLGRLKIFLTYTLLPLFNLKFQSNLRLIRLSSFFDHDQYLLNNPDVAALGVSPEKHYLLYGGFEGRNPSPHFSSQWYLQTNADVRKSGINPLVHYLRYGQVEGRKARPDGNEPAGVGMSQVSHPNIGWYAKLYKSIGFLLRNHLSPRWVERIKRFVPNPEGIPQHLTYQPVQSIEQRITFEETGIPSIASLPDIFIFSIIEWDFRYQRPQHIASGLAETGRRVFYVEQTMTAGGPELSRISDNLFKIRLSSRQTGHIQAYTGNPSTAVMMDWIKAFYEICDAVNATSFKQIIIQHPFWWQLVRHLPPEFQIIYDCMDDIAEFSNTESFIIDLENDLLQHCDRLVVSSQHLFEKYKHHKIPVLIRNAADVGHFAAPDNMTDGLDFEFKGYRNNAAEKNIKVGYVGAISDWFDVELVKASALLDPAIEFHLAGAVTNKEAVQLDELENVFMYGEIKYTEVPAFLSKVDVAIIPFQIVPIIQACDPVKFYEYSALGIPTVTTPLPELERASSLTLVASTPDEFVRQIYAGSALAKKEKHRRQLRQFALENTWAHRVNDFCETLENHSSITAVILSYGDPKLVEDCLHSLYLCGPTYPNLDVIIVDNGSSNENLEEVRKYSSSFPKVQIIEAGENLGFAKGNNLGMKAAKGDYILLLNNDTMVTPGAVYAMLRHLEQVPNAGVVGPLTNNIGNEAKLFVDYDGVEQMVEVARNITIGYRSQYTELQVLAYFAVMFHRSALEVFGYLSEDYKYGMFEDDDHCAVITSKGYKCILAEDAYVHHHLSATFSSRKDKQEIFEMNKAVFEKKWGAWKPHQYRIQRPNSSLPHGK